MTLHTDYRAARYSLLSFVMYSWCTILQILSSTSISIGLKNHIPYHPQGLGQYQRMVSWETQVWGWSCQEMGVVWSLFHLSLQSDQRNSRTYHGLADPSNTHDMYLFATMCLPQCTFLLPRHCCTRAKPRHWGAHQLQVDERQAQRHM